MKSLLPVISALECTVVKQKDTCKSWPKIIQLILCFKYESRKFMLCIAWILGLIIKALQHLLSDQADGWNSLIPVWLMPLCSEVNRKA